MKKYYRVTDAITNAVIAEGTIDQLATRMGCCENSIRAAAKTGKTIHRGTVGQVLRANPAGVWDCCQADCERRQDVNDIRLDYTRTCEGCPDVITEAWLKDRLCYRCGANGWFYGYLVGIGRFLPYVPAWCPKMVEVGE